MSNNLMSEVSQSTDSLLVSLKSFGSTVCFMVPVCTCVECTGLATILLYNDVSILSKKGSYLTEEWSDHLEIQV